ncbi:hypothetical protein ACJIZ3_014497 [Penstemon smallii]|uniref:Uncharacterized protein n=1 Tax=Penstemon smallii TaxID=265156 RepID=A0ABD3RJU2_9LAMI
MLGARVISSSFSHATLFPNCAARVPLPSLGPKLCRPAPSRFPLSRSISAAPSSPAISSSFLCHFHRASSPTCSPIDRASSNNQSSCNSSGSGISMCGRLCQCGATVRMYTSYTKMNNGRRFLRCGGVLVTHSINPGLLVRVNHLDDENQHLETVIVAIEAEIRSLGASILELKATNLALLHKLKLVKIFVMKMPLTRAQRAEMAACFDGWADHEEGYFIGRLQAAAREHDVRDLATLTDVCRRISIQMSACLGRKFSLPSLKYKLAHIRKDYHRFNGFLALTGVDYDQANNIVQIFPNIYWSEINPHAEPGCYRRFRTNGMPNYGKLSPEWPIHVRDDEEDLRAIVPIRLDMFDDEEVVDALPVAVVDPVDENPLAIVPYVGGGNVGSDDAPAGLNGNNGGGGEDGGM